MCASWKRKLGDDRGEFRKLKVAQRRMLRKIVQVPRKPEENWVSYIERAADVTESNGEAAGIESWVCVCIVEGNGAGEATSPG